MTLVCCWLDQSYGRTRITAIADSRITRESAAGFVSIVEESAIKLFRLRVRCFDMDSLQFGTGVWLNPYYETEIGLAYSGFSFEALTLIALAQRFLEQLVATEDGHQPKPSERKIVEALEVLITRYFEQHHVAEYQKVDFLVFGFSAINKTPWLAHLHHRKTAGTRIEWLPLGPTEFHLIGSVENDKEYQRKIHNLRRRIQTRIKRLRSRAASFEDDREVARLTVASSRLIETASLEAMGSEFEKTIGGKLRKIEAYESCGTTVVAFTNNTGDDDVLGGLPAVGEDNLCYLPTSAHMG